MLNLLFKFEYRGYKFLPLTKTIHLANFVRKFDDFFHWVEPPGAASGVRKADLEIAPCRDHRV